jgi:ABC-type nitrate/sulfonate/bicarbonate transport system substrate-binding protein
MPVRIVICLAFFVTASLVGCNSSTSISGSSGGNSSANNSSGGKPPQFTLAWSEYPSWSVFGVAHQKGLIHRDAGQLGELEKKWNVDVVLNQADYDGCITQYVNSAADAVCITNMDILAPSVGRPAIAVLPTSTSAGADACLAVGISDLNALKGVPTHGLEKSVSQYCFERVLERNGLKPADFPFVNMDPGVAATAMQTNQGDIKSIIVWNPFVLDTLRKRTDAKVLFDSSSIPEEIIDMIVIGQDSMSKPGAHRFVHCVADAFYTISRMIEDPQQADETLVALGAEFSNLGAADMRTVVQQTVFYKTPADALQLFESNSFREQTMPTVVEFCLSHGIIDSKPSVSFGGDAAQLRFQSDILTAIRDGATPESVQ